MNRFVVLFHRTPEHSPRPDHWDFMLEDQGALLTWALSKEPCRGESIACEQLPNHRPAYLEYEGPVSGDRGEVTRWDSGNFTWLERTPQRISIELKGRRLIGVATLETDVPKDGTGRPEEACWFTYTARPDNLV